MIIIQQPDGTNHMVLQPDHAVHVAQIMEQWDRPALLPADLWARLIEAARHHDDGWRMHRYQNMIDDDGMPYSFLTLPIDAHVKYIKHCILELVRKDIYQATIVALHFRSVVSGVIQENPESQAKAEDLVGWIDQFVDRSIERLRDEEPEVNQDAVKRPNLKRAQQILTFNDGVSLMLLGALPWMKYDQPLMFGPSEVTLRMKPDEWGVKIDPWPFAEEMFSVSVAVREVKQQRFDHSEQLIEALADAAPRRIVHRLMPY
ncbi:DUF3891 family protein [Poriferisphaera sp. WC338]|uniref:DUF3891 family protein n=1 Tax=Poriferisphaera sp. WC338 TaxID=3425129 RepID=UPI003D81441E